MTGIMLDSGRNGGYAFEFVPEPAERLQCSICCLVLRDPVQTPCGHHFCKVCIQRWLKEQGICPVDRRRLNASNLFPDSALKREILGLNVRCPNSSRGCPVLTSLHSIRAHYSRCKYIRSTKVLLPLKQPTMQPAVHARTQREERVQQNPSTPSAPPESMPPCAGGSGGAGAFLQSGSIITCPFCDLWMERGQLDIHLYMCENAFVPCPNGCDALVRPPDMEEHLTTCPQNFSQCPACGAEGSAVDVQNHMNACSQVRVRCGGCTGEFLRGEIERHRWICENTNRADTRRTRHRRRGDEESAPLLGRDGASTCSDCCNAGGTWQKILVGMLILVGLPSLFIAEVVIGAMFADECPIEPMIPLFLVAFGASESLGILLTVARIAVTDATFKKCLNVAAGLAYLFMFACLIAGSVFVYRAFPVSPFSSVPTDPNYCDTLVYWFAFGVLAAGYGLFAVALVVSTILCCLAFCTGGN